MLSETEAIVLHTRKFSDSSKIIQLFSKEFGKISVIAKGAYSAKSAFGGCLEPLSHIHITFYQKPQASLHLLKTSELVRIQNHISKDYNALIVALTITEFIAITQNDNFECKELFTSITNFLEKLNQNVGLAFQLGVKFLIYLTENMGFSIMEHQSNSAILQLIQNVSEQQVYFSRFAEIINYFALFFSEHLGKRIQIKSISLLI